MPFTFTLEKAVLKISRGLGVLTAILFVFMLLTVFINVIKRYALNDVSIGMQEMEWHLYASMFLLGVPYALSAGGHVRVDLIYEKLDAKRKAWIDIGGTFIFLIPFCALVAYFGVNFTLEAYALGETSGDPGGLPYRWIIKSMIPLSFGFTVVAGLGLVLTSVNTLLGYHDHPHYHSDI